MSSRFWVILVNLSLRMGLRHHLWMGFYCLSRKSHQQFTPAANFCSCKCMWIWWVVIHTRAELLMASDCFEVSGRAWLLLDFLPPPVICPLYNSHFLGTVLKDLTGLAIVPQGKNAMNDCPRVTLFGCAWVLFIVEKPRLHVRLFYRFYCIDTVSMFLAFSDLQNVQTPCFGTRGRRIIRQTQQAPLSWDIWQQC